MSNFDFVKIDKMLVKMFISILGNIRTIFYTERNFFFFLIKVIRFLKTIYLDANICSD